MKRFNPGFSRYLRRAFLASAGYDEVDLERPVVGIADTSSDYTTCHRAMPQLVEAVKLSPRMGSFLLSSVHIKMTAAQNQEIAF